MNRTRSPTFTLRVSGPTRTTCDHTHRFTGEAAVAGMTRPPFDRRSLSSGTFTRIRSAVSRMLPTASGTACWSGWETERSFDVAMSPDSRRLSVQDGGSDLGPVLGGPTEHG